MRLHNVVFDWEQQIRQKVFSTEQELKTKLEISKPIKEPYKFPSPIKKQIQRKHFTFDLRISIRLFEKFVQPAYFLLMI